MELRRCTYANCASHVLTVDYVPNLEETSVLHGLVSDLLTKLSPSQRHLPGTHCQLTFVIVYSSEATFKKHLKTFLFHVAFN